MTTDTNAPIETIRDGSLSAVIWSNESKFGLRYTVELKRTYKNSKDEWQSSPYLSNGETLRGSLLLTKAYTRIGELRSSSKLDEG